MSTNQIGPYRRTQQTWCISEHRNRFGPIQTDIERRGALVSTKQVGTLQADTERRGALASKKNRFGPSRQTQIDVVH